MKSSATLVSALTIAFALGVQRHAQAHEKWFYDGAELPLRWDLFFQPLPLGLTAAVIAIAIAAAWWWRRRGGRDFVPGPERFGAVSERRIIFHGLVPLILAVHVAVPLLVNGLQGQLFSPNNQLRGVGSIWIGVAQVFVALALFYGGLTRLAAILLACVWLAGIPLAGLEPMLENAHYLGFAAFFYLAGRGPVSIDRLLLPKLEPPLSLVAWAPLLLRIGVGSSLLVVGFTEKLANLPLAESFLKQHEINFTATLGMPMSDHSFALCAGAAEVLVGLLIILGVFPRLVILVALFPMNLTLTVFSWKELVGHLPLYGALAVLMVWTPTEENRRLWLAGMRRSIVPLED